MELMIEGLPYNLVINIGRITAREAGVWKEFHSITGAWPRVASVVNARGSRFEQKRKYGLSDLVSSCDSEEHF